MYLLLTGDLAAATLWCTWMWLLHILGVGEGLERGKQRGERFSANLASAWLRVGPKSVPGHPTHADPGFHLQIVFTFSSVLRGKIIFNVQKETIFACVYMKGSKCTKTRANTHVTGVKPTKSLFRMVRNPSRVERERKQTSKKSPVTLCGSLELR